MKLLVVILFLFIAKEVYSANILVLMPTPSKSHCILGDALVKGLANRGHNVTSVTTFPQSVKPTNYRELPLKKIRDKFLCRITRLGGAFQVQNMNALKFLFSIADTARQLTEETYQEESIQKLLNPNEHFDVVIISQFLNEALLGIGHYFNAPVIPLATTGPSFLVNHYVANPQPFAYVPELLLPYGDHMTFYQRTVNTLLQLYLNSYQHFVHFPKQNELMHKYVPDSPDIYDAMKNVAIILSNSHPSLNQPRPLVPAVIEVGGFHVDAEPKPLPNDLKEIMDHTPHGVIYFSLGTNVPSKDMPQKLKHIILDVFSKLKQTILWKWDEEKLDGLPKNVIIRKWFPQSDILAHPNLRLFITHGGLLSITEAVIRGVALIGMPINGDQQQNVQKAVVSGFAVQMDFTNVTSESLTWALNEALNNPRYVQNVQKRSKIIKDQIVSPLDKAIYWVEYVIRHKGAQHLRSAAMDLPLYQYLLFDVFGFLALILLIILCVLYLFVKLIVKCVKKLFKGKQKTD